MPTADLNIVHPIYNPKTGWAEALLHEYAHLKQMLPAQITIHMYLVNDGSGTGICVKDIALIKETVGQFTYIDSPVNQGKGAALRDAVRQTNGKYIIYTDADYPYLIANAVEMFHILYSDAADIVIGVRDKQYYYQLPLVRKIISMSLKKINFYFFPQLKVKDTQSGLKGFNENGKDLFLKTQIPTFLFDLEYLILASKSPNIRVHPIIIQSREGIVFSKVRVKTILIEVLNYIKILFKYSK